MGAVMRVRVTAWLPGNTERSVKKHRNVTCKLCAIKFAHDTVSEIERNMRLPEPSLKWKVENYRARDMSFNILWSSDMAPVAISAKHGH